jgi:hypothetical protein
VCLAGKQKISISEVIGLTQPGVKTDKVEMTATVLGLLFMVPNLAFA